MDPQQTLPHQLSKYQNHIECQVIFSLNDIAKLAHLSAGKEIRFQKVSLEKAEKLCNENEKYLDKVYQSIVLV